MEVGVKDETFEVLSNALLVGLFSNTQKDF